MCFSLEDTPEFYTARNGSTIAVQPKGDGKFTATVIKATDRKFPIGFQTTLQSEMAHVLCAGEEEDGQECNLHDLDATDFIDDSSIYARFNREANADQEVYEARVKAEVSTALRRRRYNIRRANGLAGQTV